MREIKYKGQRIDNNEWVYGSYIDFGERCGKSQHEISCAGVESQKYYNVKAETVAQYSGVHDNSDDEVEIYENDKISFIYEGNEYIGLVKFEAGSFIIKCKELTDEYITFIDIIDSDRNYWWIKGKVLKS